MRPRAYFKKPACWSVCAIRETLVRRTRQYAKPVRVVAFNVAEGWARDVTQEIAQAMFELGRRENSFSPSAREFVERTLHIALLPTHRESGPQLLSSLRLTELAVSKPPRLNFYGHPARTQFFANRETPNR